MSEPPSVQIERMFSAAPGVVWRGWTDPALVSRWFGSDPKGKVLMARLEVRTGGGFEVSFKDSSGAQHTCSGTYVDVEPESKLSFSWHWLSEPGIDSFVTVQLKPQAGGTLMQFEHSGLVGESSHNYGVGWRATFDKLANVLSITT